jgi:hypothetical protein
VASDAEVLAFIDCYAVFGRGIGYVDVDVHLLAAVRLTANLWTHDQRLLSAADTLGLASTIAKHRPP